MTDSGQHDTIAKSLRQALRRSTRKVSYTAPSTGALTPAELLQLIDTSEAQFAAAGLQPGIKAAVLCVDGGAGLLAQLVCLLNTSSMPLNPASTDVELEQILRARGADILFTDAPGRYLALCRRLDLPCAAISFSRDCGLTFRADVGATRTAPAPSIAPDTALILQTSGSTGTAKAVPLSHRRLLLAAGNVSQSLSLGEQDVALNCMPQFHIGAIVDVLLAPLLAGGGVVVTEGFDATQCFELATSQRVTWFQAVPTMLQNLLDHAAREHPARPDQLRFIRSVSSALPAALCTATETWFRAPVIEIYGMSETTGLIASNPLPPGRRKQGSVGLPHGPELRIVSSSGSPAIAGEAGDIEVRGPTVIDGYLGSSTPAPSDQWFRTGDLGYLDDDGYLFLTGRSKEIINRGGEKISPLEIDRVASSHDAVAEAASFRVSHPTLGEEPAIAVVPIAEKDFDKKGFRAFLRTHLADYKLPRKIYLLESLPRTAGGKLQRHKLTELCTGNAAANDSETSFTAAQRQLADTWERVLGVRPDAPDADFFDLGGDSLKAIWLIEELRDLASGQLSVVDLYHYPTLAQLQARLSTRQSDNAPDSQRFTDRQDIRSILAGLRAFVHSWKGERKKADSLLVGRNTKAASVPLFWCINSQAEFEPLAAALAPDQSIYGMRTLYKVPGRKPEHIAPVARQYLEEIRQIHPDGPYLIGGFCEGAKFAFEIATALHQEGDEVALLMLQEQFVAREYSGQAAIYACPDRTRVWASFFVEPELAWRNLYGGTTRITELKFGHADCYTEPHVSQFAELLQTDIRQALRGSLEAAGPIANFEVISPRARRAEIDVIGTRYFRAGSTRSLSVKVRNIGNQLWEPSVHSRIMLGCRWLKRDLTPRHAIAGHAMINRPLKPGASVTLDLPVKAPEKLSWRRMQIDVFQDGIGWFSDAGGDLVARRVLIY